MGIRKKIILGFFALATLLFFSGLISYFELNKLSRSTKNVLSASAKNLELSKAMLDAVQDQNTALLQMLVLKSRNGDSMLLAGRAKFERTLQEANVMISDLPALDSIYMANQRYNEVIHAHFSDPAADSNIDWFVDIYKNSYFALTSSIKNFMVSSQSVMDSKTTQLEKNAYRATMPGIIALAIAILIILIFFYFMDVYYIRPVLKITRSLGSYIRAKVPFKVEMEGRDEVYTLKEEIETLIALHKNKKSE